MLKSIGIENFKAFGLYTELELNRLNLIAGLNGSGKSSIYQALLLLIQSNKENILDDNNNPLSCLLLNGELFNFGINKEILNDIQKKYLRITLSFENGVSVSYKFVLRKIIQKELFIINTIQYKNDDDSSYQACLGDSGAWKVEAKNLLSFADYQIERLLFEHISKRIEENGKKRSNPFSTDVVFDNIKNINIPNQNLVAFSIPFGEIIHCVDPSYRDCLDLEILKKEFEEIDYKSDTIQMANSDRPVFLPSLFSERDIMYIPPFRGNPRRVYYEGNYKSPIDPNKFHDESNINYYYNLETKEIKSGSIQEAITFWISNIFKIAEDIKIKTSIQDLLSEIYVTIDGLEIPINNVGFGISQVLPVIFNLLVSNDKQLVIIDEPEIHLHPSLQSKLADFFFNMASLKKHVFIETHSEYLESLKFLQLNYHR